MRPSLLVVALASSLVLLPAPPASAQPQAAGRIPDGMDDFIRNCQPGAGTTDGPLAMDVVGADDLGVEDGVRRLRIFTREDVAAFFAGNPESAAFVVSILTGAGERFDLIREIHQGRPRTGVFQDGQEVPGTRLRATLGLAQVDFRVTGLPPLGEGATWGVTAFVITGQGTNQEFLCDRAGVGDDGLPTEPLSVGEETEPPPDETVSPAPPPDETESPAPPPDETESPPPPVTAAPTETVASGDEEPGGGLTWPWWLGFTFLLLFLLATLLGLVGTSPRYADTLERLFGNPPPAGDTAFPTLPPVPDEPQEPDEDPCADLRRRCEEARRAAEEAAERARKARERAEAARKACDDAKAARERAEAEAAEAASEPDEGDDWIEGGGRRITGRDLGLKREASKAAWESYKRGEISAQELEAEWRRLGEEDALEELRRRDREERERRQAEAERAAEDARSAEGKACDEAESAERDADAEEAAAKEAEEEADRACAEADECEELRRTEA
ncbi:MAG: hypothetical protein HY658_09660, partial [Actinobacteria bacterium]|nr:hypothetical protein [Actinomycetota bacterium]